MATVQADWQGKVLRWIPVNVSDVLQYHWNEESCLISTEYGSNCNSIHTSIEGNIQWKADTLLTVRFWLIKLTKWQVWRWSG